MTEAQASVGISIACSRPPSGLRPRPLSDWAEDGSVSVTMLAMSSIRTPV